MYSFPSTGGYCMDVSKSVEDESPELFGMSSQSTNWNVCPTHTLNTPVPCSNSSISHSFSDSRFLRLSNEFQPTDDLQTSFGDLNATEDISSGQYCFNRSQEKAPVPLEDFEDENGGFDSGFGSLELTPTEIHSEGLDEATPPQPPPPKQPIWRNPIPEPKMKYEEQPPPPLPTSFKQHIPSHQQNQQPQLQLKRCSLMMEYEAPRVIRDLGFTNSRTSFCAFPNSTEDGYCMNNVRRNPSIPSHQYRQIINRSNDCNPLYHQISPSPSFPKPLISQTSTPNNTFSVTPSSSSYPYEMSRSAPSPISHRNLIKRVAQQEASDFLSSSEGGNWDDKLDDIEGFSVETDFDDAVFPHSVENVSPQASTSSMQGGGGGGSGGGYRHCQTFSPRRGQQHSPMCGTKRSRSSALSVASIERPRKTGVSRSGGRKRNLLNFILELLTSRQTCVEWVDKPKQVFQIVNPDQLTRLWGEHKNNIKMSFDSLSRSLRLYYKPGKLERIPGTRHQYRLIQKLQECSDLNELPPYGCNPEHRRSGTSVNYSSSLKHQSSSQKPQL